MASSEYTIGQRAADIAAKNIGSWPFIISFNLVVAGWMMINGILDRPFDAYPYILLNLAFSWLAGVQAPLIMISQKRQDELQQQQVDMQKQQLETIMHLTGAIIDMLEDSKRHDKALQMDLESILRGEE